MACQLPLATIERIAREYRTSSRQKLDGIMFRPVGENVSVIDAEIQGPEGTPYYGASFVVRLSFCSDYPNVPPKGHFLTKIFHPNVSESGEICVNALKRDWKPDLTLAHILLVIRCLLIEPNPESALNEQAGMLILESFDAFAEKARQHTARLISAAGPAAATHAAAAAACAVGADAAPTPHYAAPAPRAAGADPRSKGKAAMRRL